MIIILDRLVFYVVDYILYEIEIIRCNVYT